MSFDYNTLVYDRLQSDVIKARNLREKVQSGATLTQQEWDLYFAGLKGAYNGFNDLDRVEKCTIDITERLNNYGYHFTINAKDNWTLDEEINIDDINRVKNNLQKIKDNFYVLINTPEIPSIEKTSINYIDANNIEKILFDINILIGRMEEGIRYCNCMYAGDDLGMPDTINE